MLSLGFSTPVDFSQLLVFSKGCIYIFSGKGVFSFQNYCLGPSFCQECLGMFSVCCKTKQYHGRVLDMLDVF